MALKYIIQKLTWQNKPVSLSIWRGLTDSVFVLHSDAELVVPEWFQVGDITGTASDTWN